jgi:hypothetical protein
MVYWALVWKTKFKLKLTIKFVYLKTSIKQERSIVKVEILVWKNAWNKEHYWAERDSKEAVRRGLESHNFRKVETFVSKRVCWKENGYWKKQVGYNCIQS